MELIAGPWVGEFGWELFSWQSYLRTISKHFDRVTCISRTGRDVLYEDFCDNYIAFDPPGSADSWWVLGESTFNLQLQERFSSDQVVNRQPGQPKRMDLFWLKPYGFGGENCFEVENQVGFFRDVHPTFYKYGTKIDHESEYLVFHARGRSFRDSENWEEENWNSLAREVSKKYKLFSIGTSKSSFAIQNTEDWRDKPLNEVVNLLHNAKAIVGPSSGPIHLASLCGCPQIVWSGSHLQFPPGDDYKRYSIDENPFDTKVLYFGDMGWHPSVDLVIKKISEFGL